MPATLLDLVLITGSHNDKNASPANAGMIKKKKKKNSPEGQYRITILQNTHTIKHLVENPMSSYLKTTVKKLANKRNAEEHHMCTKKNCAWHTVQNYIAVCCSKCNGHKVL